MLSVLLLLRRDEPFPLSLGPCDYAMLALVSVHLTSDVMNDGFSWMILGRMYAEGTSRTYAAEISATVLGGRGALMASVFAILCRYVLRGRFRVFSGHECFRTGVWSQA